MNSGKKLGLEGVRCIACVGVFLCHFRGAFLPGKYFALIDKTPLKIMTAGNPMVRIMFVLSGIVVSWKYFEGSKSRECALQDIKNRWFRLVPTILAANVCVCLMMYCGWLYNAEAASLSGSETFLGAFNQFEPNLLRAILEGGVATFIHGASGYIGPLWSMVYEFLGSLLLLLVLSVARDSRLRIVFYFVSLCFFSSYYNYLILGMLICDVYFNAPCVSYLKRHNIVSIVLFVASSLMIGAWQINDASKLSRTLYAVLLFVFFETLLCNQLLDHLLGNRLFVKIGELSFAIYVTHWPIVESFSSFYYIQLIRSGLSVRFAVLSDLFLSWIIILAVSMFFTKYIAPVGKRLKSGFDHISYLLFQKHMRNEERIS